MIPIKSRLFWKLTVMIAVLVVMAGCSMFDCDDDPVTPPYEPPIEISLYSPEHYPLGFVATPYSGERSIGGGKAPYFLNETSGKFAPPAWMGLSTSASGTGLVVTGTPDTEGSVETLVPLVDSEGKTGTVRVVVDVRPTNSIALTGQWSLEIDVTSANGTECEGEENDPVETDLVFLSQSGSMISINGIQGSSANTLHGFLYPSDDGIAGIEVSGSFPEDGGTTTVNYYRLTVHDAASMTGREFWEWDLGEIHCHGFSDLDLTKVP